MSTDSGRKVYDFGFSKTLGCVSRGSGFGFPRALD